jgi:hypothetical protein
MADEKETSASDPKVVKGKIQGKLLQRHPSFEDKVPGEIVEFDAKHRKSFEGVVDPHEDAVANPTVKRDSEDNPIDLELEKHLARERAKQTKPKAEK